MQIWLINSYGSIPGESWRDSRFSMIANALTGAGHDVVWWTSNFSHHSKCFRSDDWEDVRINEKFIVRLVPTTAYKKNIGMGRIWRDAVFAYRTYARGRQMLAPDCILYSETPLTFGYAGQKLAEFHHCPVVFDQIDLWLELFEKLFPPGIRSIVHFLLWPLYKNRKCIYGQLNGVMGLAEAYLEVPLQAAPVLRSRPHEVVYNGIDVKLFRQLISDPAPVKGLVPLKNKGEIWAVFAGSLGPSYDIQTILKAAEIVNRELPDLKIFMAGDGPLKVKIVEYTREKHHANFHYLGKLEPKVLCSLYGMCDIGLCAYTKISNVEMPDKIYDYAAAGLPVINSLAGEVRDLIIKNRIGLQYEGGNAESLVNALKQLATNRSLLREMATNSFKIGPQYDQRVQYAKCVALIEKFNNR
ncbi:MAG TPA: glycosyltransferase family 4 protein [Candidatus Omnitrophota bacterium]|nr:glycosyltransferase family 4 protein [Candidatus Omnitrophota bacterium]HPS36509.1 glycosyltransferase family 4 protein [Candidatus Omnitrophota bacterium]